MTCWKQLSVYIRQAMTSWCSIPGFPRNLNSCDLHCRFDSLGKRWNSRRDLSHSVYCTYVHEHKGLIAYLYHTVMFNENPHLDATYFPVPVLQSLQHIPYRLQHSHPFPRWEHFNHDGISIYYPRPLHHSLPHFNKHPLGGRKGNSRLIHNLSLELSPFPFHDCQENNFADSV